VFDKLPNLPDNMEPVTLLLSLGYSLEPFRCHVASVGSVTIARR
jgi:hypothetical protein